MCDCIKKLEQKFIEKYGAESEPKVEVIFTFSDDLDCFIPINVSIYEKKRDGSLKSKKTVVPTKGHFCPICGEKLK
jgi:formate dehydrogenase maturation protein FdhE